MARVRTYADTVNGWGELLTALEQNSAELAQLELPKQRLQTITNQIKAFTAEQAAMTASRQQATQRVEFLLAQGRKLATMLRTSVREHYGNRNQKIAEFGLQPLRTGPGSAATVNPLPQPE
ncbi:MAG: hypothetical protein ABUT39_29200 [Acidobacteriota bacterium]